MTKTILFAALAALLTTPAAAFEKNGSTAGTSLLQAEMSEAELFAARRALWLSYSDKTEADQLGGIYGRDYTEVSATAGEIKSDYVVGKGIFLTH